MLEGRLRRDPVVGVVLEELHQEVVPEGGDPRDVVVEVPRRELGEVRLVLGERLQPRPRRGRRRPQDLEDLRDLVARVVPREKWPPGNHF